MKETGGSIGTRTESGLHRALKFRYTGFRGETEIPVGTYVADGISGDGEIIEVQIGSFGPLKEKVPEFCRKGKVRIIHPIVVTKYIDVFDSDGNKQYRRKSPRKGSVWDLFKALLYAPDLPLIPKLRIELALVDVLEKRVADGLGSWRRRGQRIAGRELAAWHGSLILDSAEDYRRLVPFTGEESFTVTDFMKKTHILRPLAGKTLYVLSKMGVVNRTGKKKNAWVYVVAF
ncbi:MAG: hypothetical protein LBL28_03175 [Treponema sp.]|jgi:hypothetical protein|nr:hypothetical protein [Treponema sp.]